MAGMPLPRLAPTGDQLDVQETTFSTDALGRFVANTWDEATSSGPFTAVVVGAGAYGAYCAAEIRRSRPGARVLLLDAGSFLVSEHVQNLGMIGLEVPAPISPSADPGRAREVVWGLPWRGNVEFPGLAYCTGGKSVYWGGWCPRLTAADLADWPPAIRAWLTATYSRVESETGVVPDTDFIFGELQAALFPAVTAAAAGIGSLAGVQPPPLAVQGDSPVSGLFGYDKFSSVPLLVDVIRRDIRDAHGSDAARRLFLVPRAHVVALRTSGGTVQQIEVDVAGTRRFLDIGPGCAVVLAASAVESTRLALHSFPTPLMGRNLMAHVRSDFAVRIARSALPQLPSRVQTAAMLVRGAAPSGRFHLQLTASTSPAGSDDLLFKMIPDVEELAAHTTAPDPDWIPVTLRGIGEMTGDRAGPIPDASRSWIDLSPFEQDEFGVPRAYVHLVASPSDLATWAIMDAAALDLARAVAGAPDRIQYFWDGQWRAEPFPLNRPFPEWHRGLGTTYHESGTLWMGDDPATSVTNAVGRFHHVSNAYACDQSLFPTVGSANPVLTGLTLAKQVAAAV
jgi:GMC oxidoreductase/NAD(P)-binding Rossmann-like domain